MLMTQNQKLFQNIKSISKKNYFFLEFVDKPKIPKKINK